MASAHRNGLPSSALVVDDDSEIRESLVAFLDEFGIEDVREAGDGEEALAMLGEMTADVLLLDLMMPSVDGFEVLHALRAKAGPVRPGRIVVLSAHIDKAAAEQIKALGADACISKPFSEHELRLAIGLD